MKMMWNSLSLWQKLLMIALYITIVIGYMVFQPPLIVPVAVVVLLLMWLGYEMYKYHYVKGRIRR